MAARISKKLSVFFSFHTCGEQDVLFTASFGAVQLNEQDQSFDALLQRADKMMYVSEKVGRNRVSA